jgi:IS5 family transposase
MSQPGFFDLQQRHQWLEGSDPLIHLSRAIPWEEFRESIEQIHTQERKSAAGRPPWDAVLIMKALVLGTLYNLSDDQLEYQIRDRLSFMRFLGLQLEDGVPDAKTLWRYREQLKSREILQELFARFEQYLQKQGYQARKGQIVDATIVAVPRQRNTRRENEQLKEGEVPRSWEKNPHKLRQKDVDARWAVKQGERYYGYKNHLSVDVKYKLVRQYAVTAANLHDSQRFGQLLDEAQRHAPVYGDGAYRSTERVQQLQRRGFIERLHYKGHKHRPLNKLQRRANHARSRIRGRVEHVFGFQENSMGGKFIRCIGLARAELRIGLMNLVYNFMRLIQLQRQLQRT